MTTTLIVIGVVILLAFVAGALAWQREIGKDPLPAPTLVDRLIREAVVVTLKTGPAFSGVLYEVDDRMLTLRQAVALGAADDGQNVPVDGELVLFAVDVDYIQRP